MAKRSKIPARPFVAPVHLPVQETCPLCGYVAPVGLGLGRHKMSKLCGTRRLVDDLRARGWAPLPVSPVSRLGDAHVALLQMHSFALEKHPTKYQTNDAPARVVEQLWGPMWVVALLSAEPMLPDTRLAAIERGKADAAFRAAVEATSRLGDRHELARFINGEFP